MTDENNLCNFTNAERADEIRRLMADFERKFSEKTSAPDSFATLHEIEQMWGNLRANTDKIYSDMVQDMLGQVDETELIRKKKANTKKKE